jgi:hypothetical protein
VFIHLAILRGTVCTGDEVARLAEADSKAKFKAALDLNMKKTKDHYDALLDLRTQIRNLMTHGSFSKRGEAFRFHLRAGAGQARFSLRAKLLNTVKYSLHSRG